MLELVVVRVCRERLHLPQGYSRSQVPRISGQSLVSEYVCIDLEKFVAGWIPPFAASTDM